MRSNMIEKSQREKMKEFDVLHFKDETAKHWLQQDEKDFLDAVLLWKEAELVRKYCHDDCFATFELEVSNGGYISPRLNSVAHEGRKTPSHFMDDQD